MSIPWSVLLRQRWVWEVGVLTILVLVVIFQSHRIDRWRGLVTAQEVSTKLAEKDREIEDRENALTQLRQVMASQEDAIAQAHRTIERLRTERPALNQVMARMQERAVQDEGLVGEALRVLGVPVRLAKRCE